MNVGRVIPFALFATLAITACARSPAGSDTDPALGEEESSLKKGQPGAKNGDGDYCDDAAHPCVLGEGDCDRDGHCAAGLVCGLHNGPKFGLPTGIDACVPAHCKNGVLDSADGETRVDCGGGCGATCTNGTAPGSGSYCSSSFPCAAGEGDCDSDGECLAGLRCGARNGPRFGLPMGTDACTPPHCVNHVQDGTETDVDCGDECGACSTEAAITVQQHTGAEEPVFPGLEDEGYVSYYRAFRIADTPGMKDNFQASVVRVPIFSWWTADGIMPVEVLVYRSKTYPPSAGSLTRIAWESFDLEQQGPRDVGLDAQFARSETLVVELRFQRNYGRHQLYPAFNTSPETAPTYYRVSSAPDLDGSGLLPLSDRLPGYSWIVSVEGTTFSGDRCSTTFPCAAGRGDCDAKAECRSGLVCGVANGARFDLPAPYQACVAPHCADGIKNDTETGIDCGGECGRCHPPTLAPYDPNYCTRIFRCAAFEGDCDTDAECEAGLACGHGNGVAFDLPAGTDACVAAHCVNGCQDGDETGRDCGGECGRCPLGGPAVTLRQTLSDEIAFGWNAVPDALGYFEYYRAFRLSDYPEIHTRFRVSSIGFTVAYAFMGGGYPHAVNVYLLTSSAYPPTRDSLTYVAATSVTLYPGGGYSVDVPMGGLEFSKGDVVVTELEIYNQPMPGMGWDIIPGANSGGQTAPSYYAFGDLGSPGPGDLLPYNDGALIMPIMGTTD